jgi:hypothetical protein
MNGVICCLSMIPPIHSDRPSRVYHKPGEIFVQLHGQFGGGRLMVLAGNVSCKRTNLVMDYIDYILADTTTKFKSQQLSNSCIIIDIL